MSEKTIGEAMRDGRSGRAGESVTDLCLMEARQNEARLKAALEELRRDLESARQALGSVTADRNAIAEDRDAWRLKSETQDREINQARVLAAAILKMTEGAGDE